MVAKQGDDGDREHEADKGEKDNLDAAWGGLGHVLR